MEKGHLSTTLRIRLRHGCHSIQPPKQMFVYWWWFVNSFPLHLSQLFLEDSCENTESDNRGTETAVSRHLQPELAIPHEEEEEGLRHFWLTADSPVGLPGPDWLSRLQGLDGEERGSFYLPTTDGPPGPPGSFTLLVSSASFILISGTVSWALAPDLQVTSVTGAPSQSYRILEKTTAHYSTAPSQGREAVKVCHLLKGNVVAQWHIQLCPDVICSLPETQGKAELWASWRSLMTLAHQSK